MFLHTAKFEFDVDTDVYTVYVAEGQDLPIDITRIGTQQDKTIGKTNSNTSYIQSGMLDPYSAGTQQVKNVTKYSKFTTFWNVMTMIWNHHGKCIQSKEYRHAWCCVHYS